MNDATRPGSGRRWARVCVAQGAYYVLTGVWPLVSLRTFEAVTGPKADGWLVKTVGVLVAVIGAVLLRAGLRGAVDARAHPEVPLLATGSAAALAGIDVVYVAKGRIPPVYLADAAVELLLARRLGHRPPPAAVTGAAPRAGQAVRTPEAWPQKGQAGPGPAPPAPAPSISAPTAWPGPRAPSGERQPDGRDPVPLHPPASAGARGRWSSCRPERGLGASGAPARCTSHDLPGFAPGERQEYPLRSESEVRWRYTASGGAPAQPPRRIHLRQPA